MKKKNYTPPIMEELKVDDMKLLAGSSGVSGTVPGFEPGEGDPDPGRPPRSSGTARETQFDEFE